MPHSSGNLNHSKASKINQQTFLSKKKESPTPTRHVWVLMLRERFELRCTLFSLNESTSIVNVKSFRVCHLICWFAPFECSRLRSDCVQSERKKIKVFVSCQLIGVRSSFSSHLIHWHQYLKAWALQLRHHHHQHTRKRQKQTKQGECERVKKMEWMQIEAIAYNQSELLSN